MTLEELYSELSGVEIAMQRTFSRDEHKRLNLRRGEILGQIKQLEREANGYR